MPGSHTALRFAFRFWGHKTSTEAGRAPTQREGQNSVPSLRVHVTRYWNSGFLATNAKAKCVCLFVYFHREQALLLISGEERDVHRLPLAGAHTGDRSLDLSV